MKADFTAAIMQLLHECFEGKPDGQEYTWFVEGKEGIFDALETTGADKASRKPSAECASIAAHAYHIRYALRGANAYLGGPPQEDDWESSWAKQTVTDEEWEDLKKDIYHQYSFFIDYFSKEDLEIPEQDMVTGFVAQLPHMAFHLGAIRQIMKIV